MHFHTLVLAALSLGSLPATYAINGKSYTGWDCCKPACSWKANLGRGVSGIANTCDINNHVLSNGANAQTGCSSGGTAYLCDAYNPTPVTDNMSYGFAISSDAGNCCKCYQLQWTSGAARGKSMVVQAINVFPAGNDIGVNDLVLLTPGGGTGNNTAGCRYQYGTTWGQNNGGVGTASECATLPNNLQGGCYWRYNWAKGSINGWSISYTQTTCPSRLTSISGCSA